MRLEGFVPKGWGFENIWATNDRYCGKLLKFNTGAKFSMHFHAEKEETWYVLSGRFVVLWIDTVDASIHEQELEEGTIIEVSTPDSVEDNYRVGKGDSQR